MKRDLNIALVLGLVVALTIPSSASGCQPTTSSAFVDTDLGVGPRYYANDLGWTSCQFGIPECGSQYVYEESNGIEGWQRSDDVVDDTCAGIIPSDTIIF